MNFQLNVPQVGNGLRLLRAMRNGIVPLVIFDPQYRALMDAMGYGNEGARQAARAKLPQMTDEVIHAMLNEIVRVLRPSSYLLMWMDKHAVRQRLYWHPDLADVDLITWRKPSFGMGARARCVSEFLAVMQKPPIAAESTWRDRGIPDVWPPRDFDEVPSSSHPHAKPMGLLRRLIAATLHPGETVLDPCAGGYGVMHAAHAEGRQFVGCDLLEWKEKGEAE